MIGIDNRALLVEPASAGAFDSAGGKGAALLPCMLDAKVPDNLGRHGRPRFDKAVPEKWAHDA